MKEKLNNRFLMLGLSFLIFAVIISFRLFNLQIVEGEKYNADSQKRVLKESSIIAPRGKILDRYGVPIAVNRQGFTVKIVKTDIKTGELNEMLLKLALILEKNQKSYNDSLTKYLTFDPITFNGKSQSEIASWQRNENRLGMKEADIKSSAAELFNYLRNNKFNIDPAYSDADAYRIMKLRYEILIDNWNFTNGGTVPLARDVGMITVSEIEEKHHEFPGIVTDVEPVRQYNNAYDVGQVLGYVGAINQKQYDSMKDEGYENDDIIGQTGVEMAAERYLKGKDGKKSIEVDTSGRLTQQRETVPALPGSDIVLTIDTNLQKVAMESLARNIELIRNKGDKGNFGDADAGAVVAMDVNTGEVLAMVSYPSFDPAVYLAGPEDTVAQKIKSDLRNDTNKPLLNRAIQEIYAPGSTFKPLTAIAALETGVITPTNSRRYDNGSFVAIGGKVFKCLEFPGRGHGWLDLKKALETSCNIYFHQIGTETTIDNLDKWAREFGLGNKTGIDLPYEVAGYMSSKETKKKLHQGDDWRPADTAQVAIGQFDNSFTPLQIVDYISTIANGGKRYKPFVIKKVIKYDGSIVNETKPTYEQVDVDPSYINAVKEGMVAVTSSLDGTAKDYFTGLPFAVAGKTGTAQTGKEATHSSNALFVCYAPADKPQIAIAVVVERGVWGSYTAPVARDIIDEYFGLKKANSGSDDSLKPEEPVFVQ